MDWLQAVNLGANVSIIVVGLRLIRHLSRMEFKVDLMWATFSHKFNVNINNGEDK